VNVRRAAIAGSVTLLLGTLGFVIALRLSAYKTAQDIGHVIAAEQQWRINRTRRAEVEQLLKKYAAAKPLWCQSLCDAGIEIYSWYPVWLFNDPLARTALGKLGIRPFSLSSSFMFSDDKLSEVYASYAVVLSDGSTRLVSVGS
jgi:hypothetical protein